MLSFWIPSSVASNFINITHTSQEQSKMEENVMFDSICCHKLNYSIGNFQTTRRGII
ncbi:hypothetical protein Hdeb2414_s0045g00744781 [Helianthus debilis subsp. tardiflorus]